MKNGTHQGWQIRGNNVQSYPEKIWEQNFNNLGFEDGIDYFKEYKVNKRTDLGLDDSRNYFLDFLFIAPDGTKIDVEIDGKQHQYEKNKNLDAIRDKALKDNDFIVHRIPWISINKSKEREKEFQNQKEELIELLKKYNIL